MKKNVFYVQLYNYCYTPTLFPSMLMIIFFPLLIYLGFWQIHRGDMKKHIQSLFSQRSLSTPINLNENKNIDLDNNYFSSKMQGHFDNRHIFILENKIYLHKVGYEILTPFILKNAGQKPILVNRGWVAQGINRKYIPSLPSFEKEINLQGLIVFPNKTFSFTQVNENGWPKRIQLVSPEFLKKNNFNPFIFIINTPSPYGFTPVWQPVSLQASRHYAYAFQWFSLSATLLIAYFSTHIRRL